jgi:integrase
VGEFLDQWLTEAVRPNVRPWTYKGYEVHVRLHLKPTIGHIPLAKLAPLHVQQLLNAKRAAGLSPKSIRYIRGTLRTALNQAVRWDLLTRNPASLVDGPHVGHYEIRPFTPEEARVFLTAMKEIALKLSTPLHSRWACGKKRHSAFAGRTSTLS